MGHKHSKFQNGVHSHIILDAGLGNQLFMIAAVYARSLEYNTGFSISKTWKGMSKSRPSYWDNLLVNLQPYLTSKDYPIDYQEPLFTYYPLPGYENIHTFKGYFQSENYFKKYKSQILDLYKIPEELKNFTNKQFEKWNIKEDDVTVAVHIRRGDYLKNSTAHFIQPIGYYKTAQNEMKNKLNKEPRYIYFSDDTEWVKNNFDIKDSDIICEGFKDYEDFVLMQKCNHFIIANSTFSWWAAYLGSNKNDNLSYVMAPSEWFGPTGPPEWYTIYPKEWIIIDSKSIKFENIFFMGMITCEKYKDKRLLQNMSQCPFEYKYFIGKPELTQAMEGENNIVYLPCSDSYESLPEKVCAMLQWVIKNRSNVQYVIKADDDVRFNFKFFKNYAKFVANKDIDYAGIKVSIDAMQGTCHLGKCNNPILNKTLINIPKTVYCAGPCYFLSKKAIKIVLENLFVDYTIYEDQSIGNCLNKFDIYPHHLPIKNEACKWE